MTKPSPKPSRDDIRVAVEYVVKNHDRLRAEGTNSLLFAMGSMWGPDKVIHYEDLSEAQADLLLRLLGDIANQNPEVWGVES